MANKDVDSFGSASEKEKKPSEDDLAKEEDERHQTEAAKNASIIDDSYG